MYEELGRLLNIHVEYHETAASTNDLARGNHPAGTVIVAEKQTAGRGQRDNKWESAAGENLTFSVVLHPEFLRAGMQFYISKAVALGLCDAIAPSGSDARIKWPNDIYIGDRKVAGILIENEIMGEGISKSIIGIGLNVNQTVFDASLPNPTSLARESGERFDRADILHRIITGLGNRYGQLLDGGYETLDREYHNLLYRLDEEHTFFDAKRNKRFSGTIRGVKPAGELCVEWADPVGTEKNTARACSGGETAFHKKPDLTPPRSNDRTDSPKEPGPHIKEYLFKEIEFVLS